MKKKRKDQEDEDLEDKKAVECMVCGKLFPRPLDLVKHCQAASVQHIVEGKQSKRFSISCKACPHLFFSSEENLGLHAKLSSCPLNKDKKTLIDQNNESIQPLMNTEDRCPEVRKTRRRLSKETFPCEEIKSVFVQPLIISNEQKSSLLSSADSSELPKRAKRAKLLVPQDRKAYFAIVSLLIDPDQIPNGTQLSLDNFESFIASEKLQYIEKLKG